MQMTVIIADEASACNVGGPVSYRRVTLDLTEAQARALAIDPKWERFGPVIFEAAPADQSKEPDRE